MPPGCNGWRCIDSRTTTSLTCPVNSTLYGAASCVCGAGFQPDSTATQCVPVPTEDNSCPASNPVLPGTGRKLHDETDYLGTGAHPLTLKRLYRSQWTDGAAVRGLGPLASFDGGWRLSVQSTLTLLPGDKPRALRPDGSTFAFDPSTTVVNTWVATGSRDALVATIDAVGTRTGFTYTAWTDDQIETYDATGKLLSLRERNGWITTLLYSDATTPTTVAPWPGLLVAVRNHFGREIKFSYDAQSRIVEVLPPGAVSGTGAGSAASPIRYAYAEAASLGAGVPAQSQLTSVTWQDGTLRRYHYEDPRFAQALSGITDEAGVRYATYTYDAQGRVLRNEHIGGVDRVDFAYGFNAAGQATTTLTDYTGPNGAATSRTYSFAEQQGVLRPTAVSAPCTQCGNTQLASSYNSAGDLIKAIGHDGKVTFYVYDAKGRETEWATFDASQQGATTRPALSLALSVTSTKWHATWNLPTQVAEPQKISAFTYGTGGRLTGQSWTATTDATGASKFAAVKTGSTYATGWSYNSNVLPTTVIEKTDAVETQRWTMAYAANGDLTRVTDVSGGNRIARSTQYDVHGRLLAGTEISGRAVAMTYTLRGSLASEAYDGAVPTLHQYNSLGLRTRTTTVHGDTTEYWYDPAHRLVDTLHNGVSLSDPALGASLSQRLFLKVAALLTAMVASDAHAQAAVGAAPRPAPRPAPPLSPGILNPGAGRFQEWLQDQSGRTRERDTSCDRSRDRNCDRCDDRNPEHRGRIQAQDNPPTPYEDSVAWARCDPYTYIEAVMAVDTLMARMPTARATAKYRTAPVLAKRYFYLKSLEGGVSAEDRRSFKDVGQVNARIDAEVLKGKAYVP